MKRCAVWFLTLLSAAAILWASGIAPSAYNTIQQAAVSLARETILNFTGTGVNCVDNAGATRTDCTINGVGVANFNQAFTTQTSVTITHNLGTTAVLVQCFDAGTPPLAIVPQSIAITSANVVTVTFGAPQSGSCKVNGAAAGTATSVPFSGITAATNTTAAMLVGTGASLAPTGTGTVTANVLVGNIVSKTTTYTFLPTDYAVDADATGGNFTVNLEAAPATGQIHVLSKATAPNTVTLAGNGKNINGVANQALTTQYTSLSVQYTGTEWRIE